MKKVLIVLIILLAAGFIYYTQQNGFQKMRMRRDMENRIEDATGLDVKLRGLLNDLEDKTVDNRQFRNALNDLGEEAREKLEELSAAEMEKLKKELEEGVKDYEDLLEEYLGD